MCCTWTPHGLLLDIGKGQRNASALTPDIICAHAASIPNCWSHDSVGWHIYIYWAVICAVPPELHGYSVRIKKRHLHPRPHDTMWRRPGRPAPPFESPAGLAWGLVTGSAGRAQKGPRPKNRNVAPQRCSQAVPPGPIGGQTPTLMHQRSHRPHR